MKKKLVYVLATSQNMVFAAGNVALGLNKYMPYDEFDILILHNGLVEEDEKTLGKIRNVILESYSFPEGFEDAIGKRVTGRFGRGNALLTFCHYEIFRLLDEYETAAWVDIDTAIQGSLSGLSLHGPFGMSPDRYLTGISPNSGNFNRPVPGYDMDRPGYCAAVVVVNDKLPRYKEIYDWLWKKSIELAEYLHNPDQGIINLAIQEFKIEVNEINHYEYVCFASFKEANTAKIAHFGTERKVWVNSWYLRSFPEWYRTHLEWLKLGGSDFQRHKEMDTRNVLLKAKIYPTWLINSLCLFIPKKKNRDRFRAKYGAS